MEEAQERVVSTGLSDGHARQVVEQLVRRGYFHENAIIDTLPTSDDLESWRKLQKDPPQSFSFDLQSQIIPTLSQSDLFTREGLVRVLVCQLDAAGGRRSVHEIAHELQVDTIYLMEGSPVLSMLPATVQVLGHDFVSQQYWDRLQADIQQQLSKDGRIQLLDFAQENFVPLEYLLAKSVSKVAQATLVGGSKELVSDTFLENIKREVLETFQELDQPTMVATVCQDHGWDLEKVTGWLSTYRDELDGELHVDTTNTTSAVYTPNRYKQQQQQQILDFASTNGYMTAERANRQGVPMSQATQILQDAYSNVVVVGDVLVLDRVLQGIQVAVQELSSVGTVDLQEYLHSELIASGVVGTLLDQVGFTDSHGVAIVVDGQALILSKDKISEVFEKAVVPLLPDFAKARAEEISTAIPVVDDDEEAPSVGAHRKGKSRSKRGKAKAAKKGVETPTIGVVQLMQVAGAVLTEFPVFMNDSVEQELLDQADSLVWEDEEDTGIMLIEFCKRALYTDKFRSICEAAVKAELQRLESAKGSKATLSRKDAATKVRSVEVAFEEVFTTSCYLVQAVAKFVALASHSDHFGDPVLLESLQREFLLGCGSNLTSRITQYSLFRNEQDPIFTFVHDEDKEQGNEKGSTLPAFCTSIDAATRSYPRAYLSCPPPREPLPILRESFSGNVGVNLARQWILCGGEAYRGGVKTSDEDGSQHIRPGNMDGFLSHVEENCLSLCGLPFKKLDKKAEKHMLFARRQELTQRLQTTTDAATTLELTIMILFQQVRQVVVGGSFLRGPILKMLMEERKISEPVGMLLQKLNDAVDSGVSPIDETLIRSVKECGLSRDIGKHVVATVNA